MLRLVRALATMTAIVLLPVSVTGSVSAATPDVDLRPILDGFDRPLHVTNDGAGRTLYVVEQSGSIQRATNRSGGWVKLGTYLDVSSLIIDPDGAGDDEHGLLGLAFHPGFADNGRLYVSYTRRSEGVVRLVVADHTPEGVRGEDLGRGEVPRRERARELAVRFLGPG